MSGMAKPPLRGGSEADVLDLLKQENTIDEEPLVKAEPPPKLF
jgi:hypothetical protein